MLFGALNALDQFLTSKLKNNEVYITIVTENILFKTIVFIYCFFTSTKLIIISPKFTTDEIVNTMLSRRGINMLFIDKEIMANIVVLEKNEGININSFFNNIFTTTIMLEILLNVNHEEENNNTLTKLSKKGRLNTSSYFSILSPGTTTESCITNVHYKTLGKSMLALSHFMGLQRGDKVSVIADFEFFPSIYTILGLINGVHFVLPEKDTSLSSGEELKHMISSANHKPDVVFISSNNFKKVWDTIILNVYSNKLFFAFSKYWLTKWIINKIILRELSTIFGKQIKKIHILNEELGCSILDVLKQSKIMFSSSYGFLEEGNFLAFKDPEVFKHKDFIYKSGGTLLVNNDDLFNSVYINMEDNYELNTGENKIDFGEVCVVTNESQIVTRTLKSDDLGMLLPNISNQGERKFLFIFGRRSRYEGGQVSLDLIEKSLKDSWLVRDCFIQYNESNNCNLFVEIREDLLDIKHIKWEEIESNIVSMAKDISRNSDINIEKYAILKFNGMRNILGKLQYYNI